MSAAGADIVGWLVHADARLQEWAVQPTGMRAQQLRQQRQKIGVSRHSISTQGVRGGQDLLGACLLECLEQVFSKQHTAFLVLLSHRRMSKLATERQ